MTKLLTKSNIIFVAAIVLSIFLLSKQGGNIPTITPGQELRAVCVVDAGCPLGDTCVDGKCIKTYPREGLCDGFKITEYGKPSFQTADPPMPHMLDMPCSNDDQCQHWPPMEGIVTECCMNTGMCIQ